VNKKFGEIKTGAVYTKKLRSFNARVFRYLSADMLDEITNNTDKYSADFDLLSYYAMYDRQIGSLRVNSGVRAEYNEFDLATSDFSGQKISVNRTYLDVLPSLNLSHNKGKRQVRFSASKSLSRPEFREVANFAYYDFVRNAQILGNPKLEKTDIYNADLKYEYYPKSGENISVSFFGKMFDKPIEQVVVDGSVPSNLLLSYTNPKSATLIGTELELRKKINEWLDIYTNCSFMSSKVTVNGVSRQLQGQSNYVVNAGINLKKGNNSFNITYNRIGDRISAVGFQGYPDIFENSRNLIDATVLVKVKKMDIKISANDILAQPTVLYQKQKNRNLITTNNETNISLTLNYKL
jgi:outer membrane receptor protein involved in Fe transport